MTTLDDVLAYNKQFNRDDEDGRFTEIVSVEQIKDNDTNKKYVGIIDSDFIKLINELDEENKILRNSLERSLKRVDRQSKDLDKYYEYFTRELNWDCDRIYKEVFRW